MIYHPQFASEALYRKPNAFISYAGYSQSSIPEFVQHSEMKETGRTLIYRGAATPNSVGAQRSTTLNRITLVILI